MPVTLRSPTSPPAGLALALALAGLVALAGCRTSRPPEVVAADGVLCDLSQRLAAADLEVRCLLRPGDDPHQFRLTPQQSRELRQAPLVLINGYGLTPALGDLTRAVAVAELAVPGSPVVGHDPHHDAGHDHGDRDPHVWHDPVQASAMVRLVAQRLEARNPEARSRIAARALEMTTVLGELDRWNRQQLATIPASSPLATGHRAFPSLARAYKLKELPLVDASSSSDTLRPQAFQAVVAQLKREQVPMLFPEQLPASKALQRISALSGVPLAPAPLVADGLAPASRGFATLVATLTDNTCLIVTGLKGRCDRASQQALVQRWQAIGR